MKKKEEARGPGKKRRKESYRKGGEELSN